MKNDPTPYGKRSPLERERDMEDGFTTVEFLASSCRDVETGEPLEPTARPDLYVHDVQIVIDDWRAMEAEIERLRTLLKEAREDLASQVEHEYPKPLRDIYPSMSRRYERDMDLCYRIDVALIDKEVKDD